MGNFLYENSTDELKYFLLDVLYFVLIWSFIVKLMEYYSLQTFLKREYEEKI